MRFAAVFTTAKIERSLHTPGEGAFGVDYSGALTDHLVERERLQPNVAFAEPKTSVEIASWNLGSGGWTNVTVYSRFGSSEVVSTVTSHGFTLDFADRAWLPFRRSRDLGVYSSQAIVSLFPILLGAVAAVVGATKLMLAL